MDFLSQYENLQLAAEGETKTFRARQAATQRPVLLHQLSSNPRSGRQLHLLALVLRYTSNLRPGSPSPILGIEEQGDSVWVITEDRPELANLWDWMEREAPGREASGKAAPGGAPAASGMVPAGSTSSESLPAPAGLDEKTVLFATRLAAADSSPVVDIDATVFAPSGPPHTHTQEGSQPPSRSAQKPAPAAGDVTRFFSALPESESGDQKTAVTTPAASANHTSSEKNDSTLTLQKPEGLPSAGPDDRTRMISSPVASAPPGNFTTIFKTPTAGGSTAQPAPPQPPSENAVDLAEPPGDFTMLFRKPPGSSVAGEQKPRFMGFTAPTPEKSKFIETTQIEAAPSPAAPEPVAPPQPPALQQSGSFTMVFGSPAESEGDKTQGFSGLPDFPGPSEEGPTTASQTGEFTQVFQRPPASSFRSVESQEKQEPGAFTRIFQIPVGSDLLTAAESQTIFSHPPASNTAPSWQTDAAEKSAAMLEAPPDSPPAPAGGLLGIPATPFKPPAIPAGGGLKPPAMPSIPKPSIRRVAAPKAPPLAPPKIPAAAPKAPKLPGLEKAVGKPGPSIVPLILIFGGIVLVAALIVLFFVTRH
ncbi:MAG: hypothetical protein ACRD1I_00760 [Terriglobia bacterium]